MKMTVPTSLSTCRASSAHASRLQSRFFRSSKPPCRRFASTPSRSSTSRIYNSVRNPDELSNLLLLSSSSRVPLLTLWTTSWCSSCRAVSPLIKETIESRQDGAPVSYAEVEIDVPDNRELGMRYMITSIPTLLAFSRGEAQIRTRVSAVRDLKDREFLEGWIEQEANRGGAGGAGGDGGGILGGLFGR